MRKRDKCGITQKGKRKFGHTFHREEGSSNTSAIKELYPTCVVEGKYRIGGCRPGWNPAFQKAIFEISVMVLYENSSSTIDGHTLAYK